MISLKHLKYALAVERTLHFKKAAEYCSISPSALSTALSEFEKHLGFQVFERDNKKVLITPLGQQVLDKAKSVKLLLDDIQILGESQSKPLNGPMSIGIIPTISPFILPIILPALQSSYPELALDITEEQSHILVEQVRNGDIDAAILALPYKIDGLLSFKFWQENFYWITYANDKRSKQQLIKAKDIDTDELILLKDGHCLKDHVLSACHLEGNSWINLNATSLNTLVQLVAGEMGSTLVPEMALESLITHNDKLMKVALDEKGPHREIVFIVRPNYPRVNGIELLMALFNREMTKQIRN